MSRQFVDGIADVFVIGGVARIEFFEIVPQQTGPNAPRSERPDLQQKNTVTIAIPVEAFIKAVNMLENVRNEIRDGAQQAPNQVSRN